MTIKFQDPARLHKGYGQLHPCQALVPTGDAGRLSPLDRLVELCSAALFRNVYKISCVSPIRLHDGSDPGPDQTQCPELKTLASPRTSLLYLMTF